MDPEGFRAPIIFRPGVKEMWAAAAVLLAAQVTVPLPGAVRRPRLPVVEADLYLIVQGAYDRRDVKTRGVLSPLAPPYLALEQGTVRVMIIPVPGAENALARLVGRSVEVSGFVRRLQERQEICVPRLGLPQSFCDDPDLPPTPDRAGRASWPTVSITAWSAFDAGTGARTRAEGLSVLADIVAADAPPAGTVVVRGRFCGRSLCGDPPTPAPERGAWRIADGDASIWVVGREPRGKGWRLDPGYAADASRWLEVTGKVIPCGAERCLRASKAALAPAPRPSGEP